MGNETIKSFKELEEYKYFSKEEKTLKFIATESEFYGVLFASGPESVLGAKIILYK